MKRKITLLLACTLFLAYGCEKMDPQPNNAQAPVAGEQPEIQASVDPSAPILTDYVLTPAQLLIRKSNPAQLYQEFFDIHTAVGANEVSFLTGGTWNFGSSTSWSQWINCKLASFFIDTDNSDCGCILTNTGTEPGTIRFYLKDDGTLSNNPSADNAFACFSHNTKELNPYRVQFFNPNTSLHPDEATVAEQRTTLDRILDLLMEDFDGIPCGIEGGVLRPYRVKVTHQDNVYFHTTCVFVEVEYKVFCPPGS